MSCVLFDEKLFQIKEEISDEEKENDENTGYLFPEDILFLSCSKNLKQNSSKSQNCRSIKLKIILNRPNIDQH